MQVGGPRWDPSHVTGTSAWGGVCPRRQLRKPWRLPRWRASFQEMASWGKVAAVLRNGLRSPRALKASALRRAVGPGIVGSVIGTGVFCYYNYHTKNRILPFAVHAEEQKVSTRTIQVDVVDADRRTRLLHVAYV